MQSTETLLNEGEFQMSKHVSYSTIHSKCCKFKKGICKNIRSIIYIIWSFGLMLTKKGHCIAYQFISLLMRSATYELGQNDVL